MPMKKSVLKEIWEKEYKMLDIASQNKFRSYSDVTQRLITMWQICSGNFIPHKYKGKMFLVDSSNVYEAAEAIRNHIYPIISLNESGAEQFCKVKQIINCALADIFPEKSKFEQ